MAEELQHLINKIKKEAVEEAEKEAAGILSQAKQQAASLVSEAETKAGELIRQAEKEAEVYTERSRRALEQAARDLLITVGQGVENILSDLVATEVDQAMGIEVLRDMMVRIAERCVELHGEGRIELLISEKDQQQLIDYFADRYRQKLSHGIAIHTDNEILKGFKVSMTDGQVYQDFTREAMAEALTNFLRPHLADIVSRVASRTDSRSEGASA